MMPQMLLASDIFSSPWIILPLAAIYIWTCFRIGLTASQYGRRWWVWFLISLFLTAVPAAIFLWIDYFRLRRRQRQEEEDGEDDEQEDEPAVQTAAEPVSAQRPAVQPVASQRPEDKPSTSQAAPAAQAEQPAADSETGDSTYMLPVHAIICPNCHSTLQPGQTTRIGGVLKCLKCGLPIDEIRLA